MLAYERVCYQRRTQCNSTLSTSTVHGEGEHLQTQLVALVLDELDPHIDVLTGYEFLFVVLNEIIFGNVFYVYQPITFGSNIHKQTKSDDEGETNEQYNVMRRVGKEMSHRGGGT